MSDNNLRYVTVTCSHHHDALANGLWNLFSEKNGFDCDLRWRGQSIRAHHLILQVFLSEDKLDQSGVHVVDTTIKQDEHPLAEKIDECLDPFKSLVEFLYNGKVTVPEEHLEALLQIATELDFKMLVDSIASCRMAREQSTEYETCTKIGGGTLQKLIPRLLVRQTRTSNNGNDEECSQPNRKGFGLATEKSETRGSPLRGLKISTTVTKQSPTADIESSQLADMDIDLNATSKTDITATRKSVIAGVHRILPTKTDSSPIKPGSGKLGVSKVGVQRDQKRKLLGKRLFPCQFCDLVFRCRTTWQIHSSRHDSSVLVFRCPKCARVYRTAEQLDKHRPAHADEPDTYDCDQCDYKNPRKYLLKAHQISKHGKRVTSEEAARVEAERARSASNIDNPAFQPVVLLDDVEIKKRRVYRDIVPRRPMPHFRKNSPRTVISEDGNEGTEESAYPYKKFSCEHCGERFRQKKECYDHVRRHDPNVIILKCPKCTNTYLSTEQLEHHSQLHADEPEFYTCDLCDYKSTRRNLYRSHLSRHGFVEGVVECEVCFLAFSSKEKLDIHLTSHKIHRCTQCDYETLKFNSLKIHITTRHNVAARSKDKFDGYTACKLCDYKCKVPYYMKYHVAAKHTGERIFKCSQCPFSGVNMSDVRRHVKVIHLNIKPYLCEQCGYRTVSQSLLETHRRIHTGEKPFKCEDCDKSFGSSCILREHKHALHGGTLGARPVSVCQICGSSFRRPYRLKRHLKNVHKITTDLNALMGSRQ